MSQMTPPESPDFAPIVEVPTWPKVVGIISIVFASLGLVCGTCGIGMLAFMRPMLKMAEEQMGPAPSVMFPGPAVVGIGVLSVAVTVLLLVAGIATLKRRASGRMLHVVYAGISLVVALISTLLNWQYQSGVLAWAAANPTDKWAQQQNPVSAYSGMVIGICFGIAYPIFLLVWFGIMGKRPEVGAMNRDSII